jgi:hypothetical protein
MAKPVLDLEKTTRAIASLNQKFGRRLKNETFSIVAAEQDSSIVVTLHLAALDRSFEYRMEAASVVDDKLIHTRELALELSLDFLDWYLGEYFKNERELLLPLDWQPHKFGEFEVMARGDVRNPELDDMADAWLRGDLKPEA